MVYYNLQNIFCKKDFLQFLSKASLLSCIRLFKALKYHADQEKRKSYLNFIVSIFHFVTETWHYVITFLLNTKMRKNTKKQKKMSITQNVIMILGVVSFVGIQEPIQQCDEELAFVTWHENAHETATTPNI